MNDRKLPDKLLGMDPIRSWEEIRDVLRDNGWSVSKQRVYEVGERAVKKLKRAALADEGLRRLAREIAR